MMTKKKVAVLISGGVDSAVSLVLLKNQGYDVTAFYLKIWLEDELSFLGNCPWQEDISYITQICKQFSINCTIVPLQEAYKNKVVTYTIEEVKQGRTPSPDLFCNKFIKFGAFFDHIDESFDYVATGHYAAIEKDGNRLYLKEAVDKVKDQTYFLSRLRYEQLERLMFPLGTLTKEEVRRLANEFALPNKDRKDSQGICFLGKINFSNFIKYHVGQRIGDIVDSDTNTVIGKHNGHWFYTSGQRKGIGLSGGPWYVVKKDKEQNIVYVSKQYFSSEKKRNTCLLKDFNWISIDKLDLDKPLYVKVRHGEHKYRCSLVLDENKNHGTLILDSDDQGLAPGQFAVFYQNYICLASAMIAD